MTETQELRLHAGLFLILANVVDWPWVSIGSIAVAALLFGVSCITGNEGKHRDNT